MSAAVCLGQYNYAYYICRSKNLVVATQVQNSNESHYKESASIQFVFKAEFSNIYFALDLRIFILPLRYGLGFTKHTKK